MYIGHVVPHSRIYLSFFPSFFLSFFLCYFQGGGCFVTTRGAASVLGDVGELIIYFIQKLILSNYLF